VAWDGAILDTSGEFTSGANEVTFQGPRQFFGGGGGLVSTNTDWAKFAQMLCRYKICSVSGNIPVHSTHFSRKSSVHNMQLEYASTKYPVSRKSHIESVGIFQYEAEPYLDLDLHSP
jgi:CubicO group peptidase (beta-lactamase class C family)